MAAVHYHDGTFPPNGNLEWERLVPLLGPAAGAVARYDGALGTISNPAVLLAPLATQEAVLSSRIEGTQATMGEVLQYEAGRPAESPARREDIHEVLNYRAALREAEKALVGLPLSQRVIKGAHVTLMQGVRGEGKAPGEYRRIPNWIGQPGCTMENARFVPISADRLPAAMAAWEQYIHADAPDRLVQLAILHAEFEALHPFLDGNGRLGRMLVPLFLWQVGLIRAPMFYVSAWLEAHRDGYYDALLSVSRDGDWTGWCSFFLTAIQRQAEDNLAKAEAIVALYEDMKARIVQLTRSQYAIFALDWVMARPIFSGADFVTDAGIPKPTAHRILRVLRDHDVLSVMVPRAGRRSATFAFTALLDITDPAAGLGGQHDASDLLDVHQ